MALSFVYYFVRRVIEVVRVHRMDAVAKDAEILVLRVGCRYPMMPLSRESVRQGRIAA